VSYVGKMTARYENANVNPLNYQLIDFDFDGTTLTAAELAARILAFGNVLGANGVIAGSTTCAEIISRPVGSAGGTHVPFPTAEYVALHALYATVGTYTAYTQTIGGGVLCPLGTSVSLSKLTATPGKTGRGRYFLPFCGVSMVATDGSVDAFGRSIIEQEFHILFIGDGSPALTTATPVVRASNTLSGGHPVTNCKAQPVFSNLESRRR
jgi:hypothetical protein